MDDRQTREGDGAICTQRGHYSIRVWVHEYRCTLDGNGMSMIPWASAIGGMHYMYPTWTFIENPTCGWDIKKLRNVTSKARGVMGTDVNGIGCPVFKDRGHTACSRGISVPTVRDKSIANKTCTSQRRARVTGKPAVRRIAMNDLHDLPTWLPLAHESTFSSGNNSVADSPSYGRRERDNASIRPLPDI